MEWICYLLAKGLVERGHEVTLVGAKGSRAPEGSTLLETVDVSPNVLAEDEAYKLYKDKLKEFDIVHDHSWRKNAYLAKAEDDNLKLISTTHSQCPYRIPPPVKFPNMCGVSKAHAQYMSSALKVPVRSVYNGVDLSLYPFHAEKGNRYLSVNRIMPEKGIHLFVDLMRRQRVKGDIVGEDVKLIPDHTYVTRVQRLCDGLLVRYFGAVSNEQKLKFLQESKALICLPTPPYVEVFGLSAVEALACGTPVITLRNGGLAEIVENGKSGFVCNSVEDIELALQNDWVTQIKPEDCRLRAEQFTYQKMSEAYEKLYMEILNNLEW